MTTMFALLASAAAAAAPAPAVDVGGEADIVVTGHQTDGSDDYTVPAQVSATRLPISVKETPQSVSVVTRAQIDDFQLNDVNQLLQTVPGINVQANETDRIYYSARGFDIQTFQIDGIGTPFGFGIQVGSIDTAIYDHIEVVRGAPGLLNPSGNPSAVINFIRKRPTKELKASAAAQYGSFDSLRLDADLSVPLVSDGRLRFRTVGAYVDTDSYLDRYKLRRITGYGILEADLGPDTVASVGYGYQNHRSRGAMWGAIPLYFTDGSRIPLARSANTGPDWTTWNVIDRQIFGDVTHHINEKWVVKVSALRRAINEDNRLFYVYGNPDRTTGDGIFSYPGAFRVNQRNLTLDANVSGSVSAFGREHEVLLGFNRGAEGYRQTSSYDNSAINVPIPLANLLDGSFPRPNFPAVFDTSRGFSTDNDFKRESVYGLVRLHVADPLRLLLGGSWTNARITGFSYGSISDQATKRFQPYAGATLDLTRNISAYASYTTIFNPQRVIGPGGQLLDPLEGKNIEAGVKGEWFGGRLNASAAIFQTRQDNTAESAGFDPTIGQTIFRAVDAKSEGFDIDFGGQLFEGLQATGGVSIFRLRNDTGPVRTFVPRATGRLNLTYSPPALPALKVGAAVQAQSRFFLKPGSVSVTTGDPVRITQKGYGVLDLLGSYALTPNLSVAVNLRNVTNTKYLTALNFDQGYYAAPRTVLGTVSVRY